MPPPVAGRAFGAVSHGPDELVPTPLPPGTEPQPPSARGSPVQPVDKPHPIPPAPTVGPTTSRATAAPDATQQPIYPAKKIDNADMQPREPDLGVVGASPKEEVSYSGQVSVERCTNIWKNRDPRLLVYPPSTKTGSRHQISMLRMRMTKLLALPAQTGTRNCVISMDGL